MENNAQQDGARAAGGDKRIPVTLLTGFLGAGKTTLLNHLLRHPDLVGAAVLINEFGEIGIDHHLVERVDETMIILDSGCICCSMQGDLVKALKNLSERSARREIPALRRVLIETTGLADPVPVIYTLTQERFVAARFQCDGVITAVDATHALGQLGRHPEAVRQVAMADRLLVTKCDLAASSSRAALTARLEQLNPGATRIDVSQGQVGPEALFGCGLYTSVGKIADVAAWLGEEQVRATHLRAAGAGSQLAWRRRGIVSSHAPAGAHARHDAGVTSFVVNFDAPVAWSSFALAIGHILQRYGAKILRVKGLMNIAGNAQPQVIQCVQDVAYPPLGLAKWPEQSPFKDRRGRLVFIVRDLSRAAVETVLSALSEATGEVDTVSAQALALTLPTRCWLTHKQPVAPAASGPLDGWLVQSKHLKAS
ncbi:MAG TPA: GTP-binding protein [Burkholderiaceae bacterium]|nr:GTP-binding protein [Burkholderiaceae bacterium]